MSLRLQRDEAGAIALLAVFMAVFLTAALYYVLGIGEAILQRERLQDTADAAAFSAAVMHARGMNVLALINMVMAALLAVVIALQLVEALTTLALTAISIMSFFVPGLAPAVPGLATLRGEVQQAKDTIKPSIDAALDALHAAAVGVREAVPAASEALALENAPEGYRVIVLLPRSSLPVEDGSYAELCKHATDYLDEFARYALGTLVPGPLLGPVRAALSGLAGAGAGWFCGNGGRPPKTSITRAAHYPTLPSRTACLEPEPSASDYDRAAHERACANAEREERDAEPDPDTGECETSCGADGLYELRDARARDQCAPRDGKDALRAFDWQERRFSRSFVFQQGRWQTYSDAHSEERSATYRREHHDSRPCGAGPDAIAAAWQREPHARDAEKLVPLCATPCEPSEDTAREGSVARIDCVEVTRLFGCEEDITREYQVADARSTETKTESNDEASSRVPQTLVPKLALGDAAFQVRAVVRGPARSRVTERMLQLATWGQAAADSDRGRARAADLERGAIAQAEYFFDVKDRDEGPHNFMWSMRWKARFRRVRVPQAEPATQTTDRTRDPAQDCSRAATALGISENSPCALLEARVLH